MKNTILALLAAAVAATTLSGCLSEAPAAYVEPSSSQAAESSVAEAPADAVTSASPKESSNPADIAKGLSDSGYWIFSILSDVTMTDNLSVSGEFHDKEDATKDIYRKLALYAQDADHNVTAEYTLTVPLINVASPNFRIQNGTVKGNVHVNADGFELAGTTVDGSVTFETQGQMDSAKLGDGTVTGSVAVGDAVDAVTSASPKESSDPAELVKGLSDSGYWIFSVLSDVTVAENLTVSGEFHDKDDATKDVYRKLSLHAQDESYNITANYTLTVPEMLVQSPNFRIQNGVVKGNIVVDADGFELVGTQVEGNVTFKTQGQMDSAKLTEGTVTGTVSVG